MAEAAEHSCSYEHGAKIIVNPGILPNFVQV